MEIKELAQTIYNLCCDMDYQDYEMFLEERRKLMAEKIKKYYYSL